MSNLENSTTVTYLLNSVNMKTFAHIALMFVILTACPHEASSQMLLGKIAESLKKGPQVKTPIINNIPPVLSMQRPIDLNEKIESLKINMDFLSTLSQPPQLMIDSTLIARMRLHNRIREIIDFSKERLDHSQDELFSLLSKKDQSFAYLEYMYEVSRLHMLIKISLNPESLNNPDKTLKIMEAIYSHEMLVLPSVDIDLPQILK